ncbi:MAG: hypothetical protein LBL08_00070 [Candidatus Nomurabacteria bacterium]|jgi:hypothetical protein|nr:hypothetical protein [Candidatus Nomurabacteria bacterium]
MANENEILDSETRDEAVSDWQFSKDELEELERKQSDFRVGEYLGGIVETKLKPFFAEMLPTIFNEDLEVEVDFHSSDEVKISADKTGPSIRYETPITADGVGGIASQPATFRETLRDGNLSDTVFTREIVDSIILIHEMAHKYFDDFLMKNNESQRFLRSAPLIAQDPSSPDIIKGVSNQELLVDSKKLFTSEEIKAYGITEDMGEALAKSVERIFIEKMYSDGSLSEEQYRELLSFEQDLRANDVPLTTDDPESRVNRAYDDQVFYRLYQQMGEAGLVDFLKRIDVIGEYGIARIDPETGQYTEQYRYLIDNPSELLKIKQVNSGAPPESLASLLSSDSAKRVGVDTGKYDHA